MVSDDGILGDGTELKDAPFKDEIFTLGEVIELKKYYRIKRIIVTHIDEIWGKSYGYYSELEKKLDHISLPMMAWKLLCELKNADSRIEQEVFL